MDITGQANEKQWKDREKSWVKTKAHKQNVKVAKENIGQAQAIRTTRLQGGK